MYSMYTTIYTVQYDVHVLYGTSYCTSSAYLEGPVNDGGKDS
jgi:hypothetical protein